MIRVLFIDDDELAHRTLKAILPNSFELVSAVGGTLAIDRIHETNPDIVLLDIDMPDIDGLSVLRAIQELPEPPPVIMVSALQETDLVVQSMRGGAFDYVRKPYAFEALLEKMRNALEHQLHGLPAQTSDERDTLAEFVGVSPAVERLRRLLLRYASVDSPVLILGESGTGKDLAARLIHRLSSRSEQPFVPVNCGAVPEALFESEMFGAEKGAFTGAVTRAGSFERAQQGSLFLDEIGETSPFSQVKLLRVLEEKVAVRVGGSRAVPLDCRIIAASNRNLQHAVRSGEFRQDLFYRLAILTCEIPPLRERTDDVLVLADHFLSGSGMKNRRFHRAALQKLETHDWPGNVRELKNTVERAAVLTESPEIQAKDIQFM